MALNKVMLIGIVGKDPDVRQLESGATNAQFSLATTERYKDKNGEQKEVTEWHNIVVWRGLAEVAEKYVRKGSHLYVEGKIQTRSYEDREGVKKYITEILASSFQMIGKKSDNSESSAPSTERRPTRTAQSTKVAEVVENEDDGDDLPF